MRKGQVFFDVDALAAMKSEFILEDCFKDLPSVYGEFLRYVRGAGRDEQPDYDIFMEKFANFS